MYTQTIKQVPHKEDHAQTIKHAPHWVTDLHFHYARTPETVLCAPLQSLVPMPLNVKKDRCRQDSDCFNTSKLLSVSAKSATHNIIIIFIHTVNCMYCQ